MIVRPVLSGALENRANEIEYRIRMRRRELFSRRRARLLAALEARMPDVGSPENETIAKAAAFRELSELASKGVLSLGPLDGPRLI